MPVLMPEIANRLDPALQTAYTIDPGQPITLPLKNAFGKSFDTVEEFELFLSPENEEEKYRLNHPCTGPIEVNTHRKNISLAIHILDLKAHRGYQCISKSTGLLKDRFSERLCAFYDVVDGDTLAFRGQDLLMRGSPKLGFIATLDQEIRSCGRCCEIGGNIDLNYIDKGAIVYLPVNDDRARLMVGDLHVCQGNGEAAGIAVEADGTITFKVEIIDKINFPIIDHRHYLAIVGWGDTIEKGLQQSVTNTIAFFQRIFPFCDWSEGEIYKFISAEGNLTMGNATGKVVTCGTVFFKRRLTNKYGFSVL